MAVVHIAFIFLKIHQNCGDEHWCAHYEYNCPLLCSENRQHCLSVWAGVDFKCQIHAVSTLCLTHISVRLSKWQKKASIRQQGPSVWET